MKSKIDKLDLDKLVTVPVDLRKLRDVVKNVVKKDVYNAKIKNIEDRIPDITNLATKSTLNEKISKVKGEIPSITNLTTTAALNAKISKAKGKIPCINNLTSTIALTAAENIIPDVSNLAKKTDNNTKIKETDHDHDKYITSPELNNLTAENLLQD